MSQEAELPGRKLTLEVLQRICLRYQVISRFISGKYVLEVGCGSGLGLKYMARTASRVVAGDYSLENLRIAQKSLKSEAELVLFDAHHIPFEDDCFDVVAAMQVVVYLNTDMFFDECHRVLKNRGILILNLPNKNASNFQRSPLSKNCFSVPELFATLDRRHFDAEIFGAFPVPAQPIWSVWQKARIMTGKALNLLPKGESIKTRLVNLTSKADYILKEDIGEDIDTGIVENIQLMPIHTDSPDYRYKILYAIARAR